MPLTYVSAFLDLDEDRSKDKSFDTCFKLAEKLFTTNCCFIVFLSPNFKERVSHWNEVFPNVKIEYTELKELVTYKEVQSILHKLPPIRTDHHDTESFLTLMNAKIEFIEKAIQLNYFQSSHFAWIDFSICHVLQNWNSSKEYLEMIGIRKLKENMLVFPGCWSKGQDKESLFYRVNWRFCGGFFIGDKDSLLEFYKLYRKAFPESIRDNEVLTWEVNMWHYLELYYGLQIDWISGNHNDSIIRIPSSYFYTVASLTTIPPRIQKECRLAIDSLLSQVDHIYIAVSNQYKRFGTLDTLPEYANEEPYKTKVTFHFTEDFGPAGKYIGNVSIIPKGSLIFVCDDDQEYNPYLIERMKQNIQNSSIYQNHYSLILSKTSGGLIHGYVGLIVPYEHLYRIVNFPLPDSARYVDDQWMSIYCFMNSIPILSSGIELYSDIFAVLEQNHEKWGPCSLSGLHNRDSKINELADSFNVIFNHESLSRKE